MENGWIVRVGLLLGAVGFAGCASQIPDGIYENQCPDKSCAMRLYIGRNDVPCALGVVSGPKAMGRVCVANSLGNDNYSLLLIAKASDGNVVISKDMPQLHYERESHTVVMTSTESSAAIKEGIHLQLMAGSEDKAFNPPWPQMAEAVDSMVEENTPDLTLSDAELRQAFIGSWVIAPKDADYVKHGFISVYHADGKLEGYNYQDAGCQQLQATVHGNWKVEGGKLLLKVTDSSDLKRYPIGATSTDTIMQMGGNKLVLKAGDGAYLYRLKSQTCIALKG